MRTVRQYVRRSGHFWLCTHGPAESAFTVAIVGALPSLPFRFVSSVGSFAPRTDGVRASEWMDALLLGRKICRSVGSRFRPGLHENARRHPSI